MPLPPALCVPNSAPSVPESRVGQPHALQPPPGGRPDHARPTAPAPPAVPPAQTATANDHSQFRGKPFLTASNAFGDHSELSISKTVRERIEGVSRSLPYSDMLTLTSSHMFIAVMA
jgi:hypothetical protein